MSTVCSIVATELSVAGARQRVLPLAAVNLVIAILILMPQFSCLYTFDWLYRDGPYLFEPNDRRNVSPKWV